MLYKKIHRQYVKEFRRGRKYEYDDGCDSKVFEITRKPQIVENFIWVGNLYIIPLFSGQLLYKEEITWLD